MQRIRSLFPAILVVLATLFACGPAVQETPQGPTVEERVAQISASVLPAVVVEGDPVEKASLAELMQQSNVPGVSVAVFREGEIEWAKGFGLADVDEGSLVTPETLFQAASISKPVAATAALSLVKEGVLDLDEDVNTRLTSWKVAENELTGKEPVTLRRLLSHSAGLTVHGFPGYAAGTDVPDSVGVLEGRGNTDKILVDLMPGSEWRGRVISFVLENGKVTGFTSPGINARRVN